MGAVIAAAGSSQRMGGRDKLFADLAGRPLLAWTLAAFDACEAVDAVALVLNVEKIEQGQALAEQVVRSKPLRVVPGGVRRQDSVERGLAALDPCAWVVIHDGARPLVTPALIAAGLTAARVEGAAVAALPVTDTIKRVDARERVQETVERAALRAAQTPQVFRAELLRRAYAQAPGDVTDDAALLEALGWPVQLYPGAAENLKVTTPSDLAVAAALLKARGRESFELSSF